MPSNVCGPFAMECGICLNLLLTMGNCVRGSIHHKNGQSATFCCIVLNIVNK